MAYNTLSDAFQNARFRTGTTTTDFADTSGPLISLANKHFRRIVMSLIDNNEDWFAKISPASLVSSLSAYNLSSDSGTSGGGNIKVLRVEISYDGVNWYVASPVDYEQITPATALNSDVNDYFSTDEPKYAIFNNQIMPLPVPTQNVPGGLRIFEVVRRKEISGSSIQFMDSDDTMTIQLPKEFMEPLEDFITADIYERIGKMPEAKESKKTGAERLEQLRKQYTPRNNDFDLNMSTSAYDDYGD
jgi:hypothetical protein